MKSSTNTPLLEAFPLSTFCFKMRVLNYCDNLHLFTLSTESRVNCLICKFGNKLDMFDSVTIFPLLTFLGREPAYRKQEFPSAPRFKSYLARTPCLQAAGVWYYLLCMMSLPNSGVQLVISSRCDLYAPS